MLKLSQVAPHEWEFTYPDIYGVLMDLFHAGCEHYAQGNLDEADRVFKTVLARMPDHLDGIHHLALVLSDLSLTDQSLDLWKQAVSIGRQAFPQYFHTQQHMTVNQVLLPHS